MFEKYFTLAKYKKIRFSYYKCVMKVSFHEDEHKIARNDFQSIKSDLHFPEIITTIAAYLHCITLSFESSRVTISPLFPMVFR